MCYFTKYSKTCTTIATTIDQRCWQSHWNCPSPLSGGTTGKTSCSNFISITITHYSFHTLSLFGPKQHQPLAWHQPRQYIYRYIQGIVRSTRWIHMKHWRHAVVQICTSIRRDCWTPLWPMLSESPIPIQSYAKHSKCNYSQKEGNMIR